MHSDHADPRLRTKRWVTLEQLGLRKHFDHLADAQLIRLGMLEAVVLVDRFEIVAAAINLLGDRPVVVVRLDFVFAVCNHDACRLGPVGVAAEARRPTRRQFAVRFQVALCVTLEISICALIVGTVVGIVCGLISVSDMAIPKALVRAYVYFVRGNNVFPTAVEAVLRGLPEIAEFRCRIGSGITLEIEPSSAAANKEQLVGKVVRAVQSVLRQTRAANEILVVDDGSSDDGAALVRALGDPRIRLFEQRNGGVSAARNRGIDECHSELVAFLDADDEWLDSHLQSIVDLHSRCPGCDLFASGYLTALSGRAPIGKRMKAALIPYLIAFAAA